MGKKPQERPEGHVGTRSPAPPPNPTADRTEAPVGCMACAVVRVARTVEGVERPGGLKLAHHDTAATTPSLALLLLLFSSQHQAHSRSTKKGQKESLLFSERKKNPSVSAFTMCNRGPVVTRRHVRLLDSSCQSHFDATLVRRVALVARRVLCT